MKITGIITEYNPFHNGHLYHLTESRKKTGADYVIAVMSGDFLQRGVPAIINKYERARMALLCGADLVLELPSVYACASAEHFAFGGIALLHALGGVTDFVFGSEEGDLKLLRRAAALLSEEPEEFKNRLNHHLKAGLSFPLARHSALTETLPEFSSNLLSHPNNILGLEYLKALNRLESPIVPHCLERLGSGYHDTNLTNGGFVSASGIRSALAAGESLPDLKDYMPEAVLSILREAEGQHFPIEEEDFSALLHYKLLLSRDHFDRYADISPDLARRVRQLLPSYTDIRSFTDLLKTRNYTRTRIARILMHILLDQTEADAQNARNSALPVPYARILGFRKASSPLLKHLDVASSVPLLTKMADTERVLDSFYAESPDLSSCAKSLLARDVFAAEVYETAAAAKFHSVPANEYTQGLVLV